MIRKILCCSCFRMDKKASEAFCVLFPNEILPDIIKGRDRIYKFAQQINNEHIKAISKLSGRFAFYVEVEGGNIIREYNLLTSKRLA